MKMKKRIWLMLVLLMACLLCSGAAEEEGVRIDWLRFPDRALQIAVTEYDMDHNQVLNAEELENATIIDVTGKEVETLQGIEYLTGLTKLVCKNNQLTELDVSHNQKLEILDCGENQITKLDLSRNPELIELSCYENKLETLDVSSNTKLEKLYCRTNAMTELKVDKNTELKELFCGKNKLTELDVSRNTKLKELSCWDNLLTKLDLSNNIDLIILRCGNNKITGMDISGLSKLVDLDISGCEVTELDLSKYPDLRDFDCADCGLTELNVSRNIKLRSLYCDNNRLTKLDLNNNPELETLVCQDNQIKALDISCCPVLAKLVKENRTDDGINWSDTEAIGDNSYIVHSRMRVDKDVELYTGTGSASQDEDENASEYRMDDDPAFKMFIVEENLHVFFRQWAEKNFNFMPESLIYEQMVGGEKTEALLKKLIKKGIPLGYQFNRMDGDIGDEVITYVCTAEMDPGEGKNPRFEQLDVRMKLENGDYKIDILSLMNRRPAKYDPEKKTMVLSKDEIIADRIGDKSMERLRPIGVSCEDNGIRMEAVSGMVSDQKAMLIISLEDLNGRYDDYILNLNEVPINIGSRRSMGRVFFDRKTHKSYIEINTESDEFLKAEDQILTINSSKVNAHRFESKDLIPFLKKYGKITEGIKYPENGLEETDPTGENAMILDYTRPLNITLGDGVILNGIGWINDLLHVQIVWENAWDYSMISYPWVYDEMNRPEYEKSRRVAELPLSWTSDQKLYMEFIYDYKPEELDELRLYIRFETVPEYMSGLWEIQFPISWIYPEAAQIGVEINEDNFPDEVFREEIGLYDMDEDGRLSQTEAETITSLSLPGMGISTLKGIEYLTQLTYLDCSDNNLTELDVSNNKELVTLLCTGNQLTELDVSNNPELAEVEIN